MIYSFHACLMRFHFPSFLLSSSFLHFMMQMRRRCCTLNSNEAPQKSLCVKLFMSHDGWNANKSRDREGDDENWPQEQATKQPKENEYWGVSTGPLNSTHVCLCPVFIFFQMHENLCCGKIIIYDFQVTARARESKKHTHEIIIST